MLERYLPSNPRARAAVLTALAVGGVLVFTQFILPGRQGRGTPGAILFTGFILGVVTSVFATGVVLVYRTMRIVNFAQGPLGTVGAVAAVLFLAYTEVPFPAAVIIALVVSSLLGTLVGVFMLRFLNGSRLFLTVVTIVGAGAFGGALFFVYRLPFFPRANQLTTADIQRQSDPTLLFPFRGFSFEVGDVPLQFGFRHLFALELCAVALLGVGIFLRYTRPGVAVRAISENPERASLLGIGVGGLTVLVWTIAGFLDGVGALAGSAATADLGGGFTALLPPFAAAVLGRFRNLAVTITSAILIGVTKEAWEYSLQKDGDLFYVLLFAVTAGGFLFQRARRGRSETGADVSWAATEEPRPVPKELAGITSLRLLRFGLAAVGLLAVVLFPFIATTNRIELGSVIAIEAIAVLSLVVLTGWAGQVSLGQWALVAVGSVIGGALSSKAGVPFWLAVPITTALVAAIAVVVGIPALRIKGLFLLVSTFAFAAAIQAVLFDRRYFGWLLTDAVERPTLFFLDFEEPRSMYFLCVAALVLAIVVVGNLRRSRVGRVLIALRENEANVQSFGITALRAKLLAFAIAGGLAGFAGAIFAHQQRGVAEASFRPEENVEVFLQAVIGGVSSPGGALLGAAYFEIVQTFLESQEVVGTFLTSGGPLLILFVAPGGFISVINAMRDSVLRVVAQRRRIVVPSLFADYDPDVLARRLIPLSEPETTSGLAALPVDDRFVLESELYQGEGDRISDRLAPPREDEEHAVLGAAARGAIEAEADAWAVPQP